MIKYITLFSVFALGGGYIYALEWHNHSVSHMWRYQKALEGKTINVHGYVKKVSSDHYFIMDDECFATYRIYFDRLGGKQGEFLRRVPEPSYPNKRTALIEGKFKAKASRVDGTFFFNVVEVKEAKLVDITSLGKNIPIACKG